METAFIRYSTDFDGIVLPYQSPRLHILNPVMRRIYESGIVFVLYDKYKLDMTTKEKEVVFITFKRFAR